MTALNEYDRLESSGLWRPTPDAQRREVTVSFGNATLVITDSAERPLAHWSLPAIERLTPKNRPAIFAPDPDGSEMLELDDDLMINAIEKVRSTLARSRPQPGRLRYLLTFGVLAVVVAGAVFWLPDALRSQTVTALPDAKRDQIGAVILGQMQRLTGPRCKDTQGEAALARLHQRLFGPDTDGQIVVLPELRQIATALPGGIIAVNRRVIENADDPAVPAGYIVAATATRDTDNPMANVLRSAGLRATLTLLTTGNMPLETLSGHARILTDAEPDFPDTPTLLTAFEAAQIPTSPFAYARDDTGKRTSELITADSYAERDEPEILSDADWIRLQGICNF